MTSPPATQASVNRVALDRFMAQPLGSFAEVREMVTIQRGGVQHFDSAKINTGVRVRVNNLLLDDEIAELLSAITATL